jgi:hypothetical protein
MYSISEVDELYEVVGNVLSKAIYEKITIHPQFAHFFKDSKGKALASDSIRVWV